MLPMRPWALDQAQVHRSPDFLLKHHQSHHNRRPLMQHPPACRAVDVVNAH